MAERGRQFSWASCLFRANSKAFGGSSFRCASPLGQEMRDDPRDLRQRIASPGMEIDGCEREQINAILNG